MQHIDGFQTTDSFRFDRDASSSSISLSSSSGYGSRLSLSQTDHSSNRRIGLSKYFKEKISRHKSLALLALSPKYEIYNKNQTEIYESVWNLDEQINKIRSKMHSDCQSIISMSVDQPEQIQDQIHIDNDQELLSAAAWYQQGLPRHICEEYLNDDNQPIGSFIIRHSYTHREYPLVMSIKTNVSLVEHFLIKRTIDNNGYRFQGSSKTFDNLSTLVLHHTIIHDILPVTLRLPNISTPFNDINQQRSSTSGVIHSVRF